MNESGPSNGPKAQATLSHIAKLPPGARRGRRRLWMALVLIVALGALAALGVQKAFLASQETADELATTKVRRGHLRINVSEGGHIEAQRSVAVKCEVPGRSTIIKIVEEGSYVKAGDVLVVLDSSDLEERITQQQISCEQAEASYIQAKEQFEIQKSENESKIKAAELKVQFADKDLEKFIEGDQPQRLRSANADITIATEERERAIEKYDATKRLHKKGYITETELKADKLALKRAELRLEEAVAALDLLERYALERERIQLTTDYEEAIKARERTDRQARAQLTKAEADLKAKESTLKLQKARLAKQKDQFAQSTIKAPQAGLVVYAGSQRRYQTVRIEEGAQVRERQTLIQLPDVSTMKVNTKVHESVVDKISVGLKATVRIDAFPDLVLGGEVASVAVLPDSQSRWMNPDLKVYTTEVRILNQRDDLKPGMSARVEILIADLNDVVYVPIQSVTVREGKNVCFVVEHGRVQPRTVETGMNNDDFVEIKNGLREGQDVLLYAPIATQKEEAGQEEPQDEEPARESAGPKQKAKKPPAKEELRSVRQRKQPSDAQKAPSDERGGPARPPSRTKAQSKHPRQPLTDAQKAQMRKWRDASPEEREKMRAMRRGKSGARRKSTGKRRPSTKAQPQGKD